MVTTQTKATTTKKVTAKKTVTPKAAVESKRVVKKTSSKKPTKTISLEERYKMTEVAAYFLAMQNNFAGNATDYWIRAEAQIELVLKAK